MSRAERVAKAKVAGQIELYSHMVAHIKAVAEVGLYLGI
jgi:hypothetical protein